MYQNIPAEGHGSKTTSMVAYLNEATVVVYSSDPYHKYLSVLSTFSNYFKKARATVGNIFLPEKDFPVSSFVPI